MNKACSEKRLPNNIEKVDIRHPSTEKGVKTAPKKGARGSKNPPLGPIGPPWPRTIPKNIETVPKMEPRGSQIASKWSPGVLKIEIWHPTSHPNQPVRIGLLTSALPVLTASGFGVPPHRRHFWFSCCLQVGAGGRGACPLDI